MAERKMCKLCPHELSGFANLAVHVRGKHKLSMEDFNAIEEQEYNEVLEDIKPFKTKDENLEPPINIEDSDTITPEDLSKAIFNDTERKSADRPLSEFCEEHEITERDLTTLVNKWKGEAEMPVMDIIENKEKVGIKNADKVAKTLPKVVRTFDAFEAQTLREKYGYKNKAIIGPKGSVPKTYVVELI